MKFSFLKKIFPPQLLIQLIALTVINLFCTPITRAAEINTSSYDIYYTDLNTDSFTDLYFAGKPTFIFLFGDITIPIVIGTSSSFAVYGTPSGYTDPAVPYQLTAAALSQKIQASTAKLAQLNTDFFVLNNKVSGLSALLVRGATTSAPALLLGSNSAQALPQLLNIYTPNASANLSDRTKTISFADKNNDGLADFTIGNYAYLSNASGLPSVATTDISIPPAIDYIQASDTTISVYDSMSRPVGTISPDPDGPGPLPRQATRTTYNASTALVERVETGTLAALPPSNQAPVAWSGFTLVSKQELAYDSYGRNTTTTVYGSNAQAVSLTQVNYDAYSNVLCKAVRMNPAVYNSLPDACSLSTEGSEGPDRISKFTYDEYRQVTSQRKAVATTLEQTYVTNEYLGHNLTAQTDANNNRTELLYGPGWRLERMVFPNPNTINAVNESDYVHFEYDANGNKIKERKRNGAEVSYTLDNNNRVIVKDYANNASQADVYFDYDNRGLLLSSRFNSTTGVGITNSFDGFGRLKTSTNNQGTSRTLTYAYDANSNRTQITHPDGKVFSYGFDGLNRVQGVADSATANSNLLSVAYQANGRRQTLTRNGSAGGVTSYNFNNGVQLNNFQQSFSTTTNNLSNDFTYNKAGQITELTQSNSAYFYTGNENRTGDYTPDGLNRYKKIGGQALAYDANSNLTNDLIQAYAYDDENRLLSVNGATNGSFIYDPNGRLFQVTIAGVNRQFLYDGDALIAEYAADGSMLRRYVHGDQVDEPWLQYNGNSVVAT